MVYTKRIKSMHKQLDVMRGDVLNNLDFLPKVFI